MSKSEAGLWQTLSKMMKAHNGADWHAERIETGATALGQPDANYCLYGVENDLELKFAKNGIFELRPSQYQWFKRRVAAGGWPLILAEYSDENGAPVYLLIHGASVEGLIKDGSVANWRNLAFRIWEGKLVAEELTGELMDWIHLLGSDQ